jgi:glycosyltransferase involved in cell wall biosynthesis
MSSTCGEPRISVTIPSLDPGRFAEETIGSVITQSYTASELLLVDEGSSVNSTDFARSYTLRHPKQIRYLEHDGHANLDATLVTQSRAGPREWRIHRTTRHR